MPSRILDDGDEQKPADQRTAECPMCHVMVPEKFLLWRGGRRLCVSCYGSWFEDDEDEKHRD